MKRRRASCAVSIGLGSEEARFVRVVADKDIPGLLVVVRHHLVRLAPDAGLPVAAKGRVGGVGVAVVSPDATGFDVAAKAAGAGVWEAISESVVQAENLRAELMLVSLGEAPFGIVYASDAVADRTVTVVGTFPTGSHAAKVIRPKLSGGTADRAFLEA